MTKQAILKVTGMRCSGCVANVEKALRGVTGVSQVTTDLKSGKATVEFDPSKTDEKSLANAVIKAGYKVG
jgi:copper ion binding protein